MLVMVSPLHRVIDAGRWDAERLLGRLIIVVHAAFLDAGFVPVAVRHRSRMPGAVPRQAGRTASSLSLRYAPPQLLHRRDAETAAVLRIQAHGSSHLILSVQCEPWPAERCVLVDAVAAAPLVAGGLDATARALRSDARTAALWRRISDDLCRRALVDACRRSGVALEPTFVSLPGDAVAAILARLTDGVDLARVQCVCTALRRVVAEHDRELWKPNYDALRLAPLLLPDSGGGGGGGSPGMSWKERYVRARRWQLATSSSRLQTAPRRLSFHFLPGDEELILPYLLRRLWDHTRRPADPDDDTTDTELPADPVAERRCKAAARGKHAGHQALRSRRQEKRRRGAGAIHAPSSRYRWKYR